MYLHINLLKLSSVCQSATVLVHGQVTITFVVSVGLSVCLSVQFFSAVFDPISINVDICYMSGSSCVP